MIKQLPNQIKTLVGNQSATMFKSERTSGEIKTTVLYVLRKIKITSSLVNTNQAKIISWLMVMKGFTKISQSLLVVNLSLKQLLL